MILDDILAETRREVAHAKETTPLAVVEAAALRTPAPRSLAQALRLPGEIACIAEIKRRSPSAGWIRKNADAAKVAENYEQAGAQALSVLTNSPFFGGSLGDLEQARAHVDIPILRKDFIFDPYQVVEARACGADAVLLIVAALSDEDLHRLLAETARWDLEALVEVHSADETDRAVASGASIIGINHRDLRTFTLDMSLSRRLRPMIPPDRVVVAESGIKQADDVSSLYEVGINAILIGETLMKAEDPAAALRRLFEIP
jgi:indole-3-glycerol phosphate synthase